MDANNMAFAGNLVAMMALCGKTAFDYFNRKYFTLETRRMPDSDTKIDREIEAKERMLERRDRSITITFALMAISYLFILGGDIVSRKTATLKKDVLAAKQKIDDIDHRVKDIENKMPPPGGGGLGERLGKIEKDLEDVRTNHDLFTKTTAQRLSRLNAISEELREIVNELRETIEVERPIQ